MKLSLRKIFVGLAWLYAGVITIWFALHGWRGDSLWWLALLNSFVPYFFLPLLFLLPACLVWRRHSFYSSLLLPMFIFISLYGELFLPKPRISSAAVTPTTLSIMTFNMWGGSRLKETAQAILENGKPEIVALQEISPLMTKVLEEEIGTQYPYRLLDPQDHYRGIGLLSRYPVREIDAGYLSDPSWQLQIVRVEIGDRAFTLYNVHPYSTNILAYFEDGLSMAEEVQKSYQVRKRLIESLITDIEKQDGPVMVVGDFNSTDQSDVYRLIRSRLIDAHRAAGWGWGHTFPAYAGNYHGIPIFARQMRIDMIFYSKEFMALDCRAGSSYGESDHLPVLAELAWPR